VKLGDDPLEIGRFRGRGPATRRERSEFLHLRISNFNTRSNLIALAEYKGSQLKPDRRSPADAAGPTSHHSVERGVAFG
jgi:hypothetical protein